MGRNERRKAERKETELEQAVKFEKGRQRKRERETERKGERERIISCQ